MGQEKLNKLQYSEDQARSEKERSELEVMKLSRELEKLQYQIQMTEDKRGVRERDRSAHRDGDSRQLEEVHLKLDRANLELKSLSEENERLEVEARKFKNQLEHSRTLLDAAFENEAKCKSETEATKREMIRIQDRFEQAEAELRHIRLEKDKYQSEYSSKSKTAEGDLDKLQLEIAQLTTERDQLVRQLEKSQDMLLSFQQDLNLTGSELK